MNSIHEQEDIAELIRVAALPKAAKPEDVPSAEQSSHDVIADMGKWIETAPETDSSIITEKPVEFVLPFKSGFGKRYRIAWDRPQDAAWRSLLSGITAMAIKGSTVTLAGNRGTGKTQLSAEIAKDTFPNHCAYTTAMALFVRIRNTFRKDSTESEQQIVKEMTKAKLLVIDELQERGESGWEDRLLTHIIDARYAAMASTIIIANLKREEIATALGESISDRMREGGGIIELTGESFRK